MNSNGYSVVCFLIGSIFGLVSAIWDVAWDTSILGDDDDPMSAAGNLVYNAVLILAPFFYLLEAVFDISSAERIRSDSIFFGIGAICELLAAILGQNERTNGLPNRIITLISTHAYILNVTVLLLMDHNQQGLIFYGNIIFGLGASIDLILSYEFVWNPLWLDYGNLLSAVCWFLDALVYVVAHKNQDDAADDDSSDSNTASNFWANGTPLLPQLSSDAMEQSSENSSGSSIRHRNIGPQPSISGTLFAPPHLL